MLCIGSVLGVPSAPRNVVCAISVTRTLNDMGLCAPQSYIKVTIWVFSVWGLAVGSPSFKKWEIHTLDKIGVP